MNLINVIATAATALALNRSIAQISTPDKEVDTLLREAVMRAQSGPDVTVWKAGEDTVLERLVSEDSATVAATLPEIVDFGNSPYASVRGLVALALWQVSRRQDARILLSAETETFAKLLVDTNLPVRRVAILAIYTLHPDAKSPFVPILRSFLLRPDAVTTVGATVAPVLLEAASGVSDVIVAIARYMGRDDQTSQTRDTLLDSIALLRSHRIVIGPEVCHEVASFADDPNEQTSVHAIETLRSMGDSVVEENRKALSRIASDMRRPPTVRSAAAQALSVNH